MLNVVAIDIGGTNTRIGNIDECGNLSDFSKEFTLELSKKGMVESLIEKIRERINENTQAITIGVPSMVSKDKSTIYSTPNFKLLENISLKSKLQEYFNIPIYIDRDVNYLLLNDIYQHNLDPNLDKTIMGVYLGTGIGNTLYINGKLFVGKNGAAAELGHIPLRGVKTLCSCGNQGCSETVVSGKYLEYLCFNNFGQSNIKKVFTEHLEKKEIQEFIEDLAIVISIEINIIDPDYIILGGGVLDMENFPIKLLVEKIKVHVRSPYPLNSLNFIFPKQVQESGVIGGGLSVFKKYKSSTLKKNRTICSKETI